MSTIKLTELSTFDLAFNLATGVYKDEEKMEALSIIKNRDIKGVSTPTDNTTPLAPKNLKTKPAKKPVKGSKAEMIQNYLDQGKTPKEIYDLINAKKGMKVYYPEIYRLFNQSK